MRLWHKDLIPYLPQKQLVAQWRELCCIAKNIADNGTPNHILVNQILDYPIINIYNYVDLVIKEMKRRGYNVSYESYSNCVENLRSGQKYFFPGIMMGNGLFEPWMCNRYLIQCYYNLQEKYDCGGISVEEWKRINDFVISKIGITHEGVK